MNKTPKEIFSLCKEEIAKFVKRYNLVMDEYTLNDVSIHAFEDCIRYSESLEKEKDETFVRVVIKRLIFKK